MRKNKLSFVKRYTYTLSLISWGLAIAMLINVLLQLIIGVDRIFEFYSRVGRPSLTIWLSLFFIFVISAISFSLYGNKRKSEILELNVVFCVIHTVCQLMLMFWWTGNLFFYISILTLFVSIGLFFPILKKV
jgi:hypothetical protein